MRSVRLIVLIGLAAAATAFRARAYEINGWPAVVIQKDVSGETQSWTGIGPLLYSEPVPGPDAGHASGLRPFYGRLTIGETDRTLLLYPLFYLRQYPDHYKWSILELINGEGVDSNTTKAGGPLDKHFDVWPFYFSHETGDPVDSYRALLPIYGNMKYRLGFDRLFWAPFPLYVETVKRGTTVAYAPWPILRFIRGAQNGFAIWPLFGSSEGPGPAKHFFCLWPLIWNNTLEPALDAPEGSAPGTEVGFLPFYTRETAPGYVSANFAWPFFGYTERTIPYRYSEQRYFWPFFVQGRGDDRLVDRWGPFYTHSNIKGTDTKWVGWPFWHRTRFADDDIEQTKTQFFYFLYWSLDERSVSRPACGAGLQAPPLAAPEHLGQRGGQQAAPGAEPDRGLFPGQPRDARDVGPALLPLPLRPPADRREPDLAPVERGHLAPGHHGAAIRVPPGPPIRHAQEAVR